MHPPCRRCVRYAPCSPSIAGPVAPMRMWSGTKLPYSPKPPSVTAVVQPGAAMTLASWIGSAGIATHLAAPQAAARSPARPCNHSQGSVVARLTFGEPCEPMADRMFRPTAGHAGRLAEDGPSSHGAQASVRARVPSLCLFPPWPDADERTRTWWRLRSRDGTVPPRPVCTGSRPRSSATACREVPF